MERQACFAAPYKARGEEKKKGFSPASITYGREEGRVIDVGRVTEERERGKGYRWLRETAMTPLFAKGG